MNILKRQFTSSAHPRKHENGERERKCFPEFQWTIISDLPSPWPGIHIQDKLTKEILFNNSQVVTGSDIQQESMSQLLTSQSKQKQINFSACLLTEGRCLSPKFVRLPWPLKDAVTLLTEKSFNTWQQANFNSQLT